MLLQLTNLVAVSSEFKRNCQTNCQRLCPGLHRLKQTVAQTIKDLRKTLLFWKKEISQPMNAVEDFLNVSLPYTVAFKQQCYVQCCQCKQASPQQPIKTRADFVKKDNCMKYERDIHSKQSYEAISLLAWQPFIV